MPKQSNPYNLFDIRIEVSEIGGLYKARTILGNNGILFEGVSDNIADAMCDMICNADVSGGWQMVQQNTTLTHNFLQRWGGTKKIAVAVPTNSPPQKNFSAGPAKKKYSGPLQRAVDIPFDVPKGTCEDMCQAYDMFGAGKCSSFCPGRK